MTEILDEAAVSEIEARANAATPGPWDYHGYTLSYHIARVRDGHYHESPRVVHATLGGSVYDADNAETGAGGVRKMSDAAFIAHAREDIPALCATVKHLRELAYLPKVLPDDEEVTFQETSARLLKEKLALQSQLEQLRATLAQVEQERDELRSHIADLNHDLEAAIKECNEHSDH